VINFENGSNVFQIWKTQVGGAMYVRSGNANGWGQQWTELLTTNGGSISGEVDFTGGLVRVKGNQTFYATDTRLTLGTNNLETYICGDGIVSRSAITVASDERLKKNIKPFDTKKLADFISKLEIVDFQYKGDDKKHVGVIAQQVQKADSEVAERLVNVDKAGFLSVSFSELVFPLIAAVQDLQKRVAELEKGK
ncbi:MAG: tail fiber domain-containing protein, partial [Elusimicrobiaceae bacterium]|nr:tail fiber domain-containing protein [Elusimicrobiaceae bacterium]